MISRQKILIVDDKNENLVALRHVLHDVDCEIIAAASGNEALSATLDHTFALAILDVMMPGMSGFELAEHLKSDAATRLIPIIFVTALQPDEQHLFSGYEAGGVEYIVKPYAPEILLAKVRIFLALNRKQLELQWQKEHLDALVAERTRELEHELAARKQAEQEREALQAQLHQAQKMESIGRLAGGVAHDFNNMLSVITSHAELALMKMSDGHPFFHDMTEIRTAAGRSADLTRQLLAFARKQAVTPQLLDLNRTVEGMLKMLRRLIGEDIDLQWQPGENIWPIHIDPGQIDQILANLCVNARDAIDGIGAVTIGTDTATIGTASDELSPQRTPGEYVVVIVGDTGCGMDTKTLENIFEPFFTTKDSGKGTGLGLASVYGAVKQNDGFITVDSEPGVGTVFRIYFPRHSGTLIEVQKEAATLQAMTGSETILLVEDEPGILEVTTMLLESFGYRTLSTTKASEAIKLAEEHAGTIDLLMTDVIMPEMNGRDLAQHIQSLRPNIKQLFMSGYTADIIANQGKLEEGVNFIQKPFSFKTLADKVRSALGSTT
jgi:signal transduction histidine kinase